MNKDACFLLLKLILTFAMGFSLLFFLSCGDDDDDDDRQTYNMIEPKALLFDYTEGVWSVDYLEDIFLWSLEYVPGE